MSKYVRFTGAWKKDFHVSPFNSRDGSYTLTAHDLFENKDEIDTRLSNTINLFSSGGHLKLIARIFSTSTAVNPQTCSFSDQIRLFASYGWVGFITFPRILKEAKTLFFSKKIAVFFRPEVMNSSISRRATDNERFVMITDTNGFLQRTSLLSGYLFHRFVSANWSAFSPLGIACSVYAVAHSIDIRNSSGCHCQASFLISF